METLRAYMNGLTVDQQADFARRCRTSVGYLRKVISAKTKLGESLCIAIDRESGGVVRVEDLRPDVDWAYLKKRRNAA